MSTTAIVLLLIGATALLLAAAAIRIVREYERVVGRLRGQPGPGLVLMIPLSTAHAWSTCRSTPPTSPRRI